MAPMTKRSSGPLKLWLLSWATKPEDVEFDFFRRVVVAAPDAEAARRIHPVEDPGRMDAEGWVSDIEGQWAEAPDEVSVMLLGEAAGGVDVGVICVEFVSGG
jgi:hypothetical protein